MRRSSHRRMLYEAQLMAVRTMSTGEVWAAFRAFVAYPPWRTSTLYTTVLLACRTVLRERGEPA